MAYLERLGADKTAAAELQESDDLEVARRLVKAAAPRVPEAL